MTDTVLDMRGVVLIAGAGPTGLMLAIELARHGVTPRVIERRLAPATTSRALAVFARTLELFDRVGVIDEALAAGRRLRGGVIHDGHGRDIASLTTDHLDSPFPFVLSLPQADTERILVRRAESFGIRIERGMQLERIDGAAGRSPVAHVQRDDGAGETIACEWIIGSDGAHSEVREQAGIAFKGVDLHQSFVFADAKPSWRLADDRFHAFFWPGGVIAAVPMPEPGLWRLIASLPRGSRPPDDPTLAMIEATMRERTRLDVALHDPRWVTGFEVRQRRVDRCRAGRILLAGDAAHAHSPIGGQGMNTGLQDAANLGWKLALVLAGRADESLLDTYHEERSPVARRLLRGTGFATRLGTISSPMAITLRNEVLRRVFGIARIRRRLIDAVSEIRIHYRGGRLSIDHAPPSEFRAGDRAPDLPLTMIDGRTARLHALLREPGFHLLVFVREPAPRAMPRPGELLTVHEIDRERSSEASARLGACRAAAVLIRPDGHVGARFASLRDDSIERYPGLARASDR